MSDTPPANWSHRVIEFTEQSIPFNRLLDMRVDYLRPAAQERLVADAQVQRMGNRVAAVQVVVHQGDPDEPIALGRCVYNVKRDLGEPILKQRDP